MSSEMTFVAFDTETANSSRASICSLGATVVTNGVVTDERSWLIRPPEGHDEFFARNVSIHGITPEMVQHKPRFGELWPEISQYLDGHTVVAHNASFDTSVVRYACETSGHPWPEWTYGCTYVMARQALDLVSYRLPIVAVEHPGGGRQRGPVGDGLDGASDCGGQAFELLASDRWGVLFSAACGGDFATFPDADLASADTGSDGELELGEPVLEADGTDGASKRSCLVGCHHPSPTSAGWSLATTDQRPASWVVESTVSTVWWSTSHARRWRSICACRSVGAVPMTYMIVIVPGLSTCCQ